MKSTGRDRSGPVLVTAQPKPSNPINHKITLNLKKPNHISYSRNQSIRPIWPVSKVGLANTTVAPLFLKPTSHHIAAQSRGRVNADVGEHWAPSIDVIIFRRSCRSVSCYTLPMTRFPCPVPPSSLYRVAIGSMLQEEVRPVRDSMQCVKARLRACVCDVFTGIFDDDLPATALAWRTLPRARRLYTRV